ncbi:MAG: electron transport complex subunit E [Pontibacterium sp.]
MAQPDLKKVTLDGLWDNNPALVQLLGLCPLLAVTGSVVNAIGLGIASILVLIGSNFTISLFRQFVPESVRLPIFVMIIASFVTSIELLMKAYTFELYQILGIFIPLIVTNCAIMGRADAFACKNPVHASVVDALAMGVGFSIVLVLLGAMREVLGTGAIFADMHLLFGESAASWKLVLMDDYQGLLFAILPPGAFVGLGIIIAAKNILDERIKHWRNKKQAPTQAAERVRVTG